MNEEALAIEHLRKIGNKLSRLLPSIAPAQHQRLLSSKAAVVARPDSRSGAASLEERLIQRITFGWHFGLQQEVESMGWQAFLDQQLEPEQIDDGGLEDALLEALPSLSMTPLERVIAFQETRVFPIVELGIATMLRALYSPRQLFERTTELWNDHLHTSVEADLGPFLKADYDRAIRDRAMSSFRELLGVSAHSPAMLDYLTNNTNRKGRPNENYARELMELHTLGVNAGFTQTDVQQVAAALTGWTFIDPRIGEESFGSFHFLDFFHDTDPKVVLGQTLPGNRGVEDGEQVLDILSADENTARFVARKVLIQFCGYKPTESQIDRVATAYLDHQGDVREMLRATLTWHNLATAPPKLKRPFHLAVSALRALFANLDDLSSVLQWTLSAGHFPFFWGPPNGYPDSEGYWSGSPLGRWNFANRILAGGQSIQSIVNELGSSESREELVTTLDLLLFNGSIDQVTKDTLLDFAAQRPFNRILTREAIGLAASSPDFQYY